MSSHAAETDNEDEDGAREQIRWDRAWHTITTFLAIPNEAIIAQDEVVLKGKWTKPFTVEVSTATSYLVSDDSRARQQRAGKAEDDVISWYSHEVGRHYIGWQLCLLLKVEYSVFKY